MHARYRRAASIAVAMTILLGLPLGGGAWLSSGPADAGDAQVTGWSASADGEVGVPASGAELALPRSIAPGGVDSSPVPPDPTPDAPVQDWMCSVDADIDACRPPKIASGISTDTPTTEPGAPSVPETGASAPAIIGDLRPVSPDAPTIDRTIPIEPDAAEDWRGLIALFFAPSDVERAVDVVHCESRGRSDAKNPRSTASGLFQHLASLWPERAQKAGYAGSDVFDPVANTAVAAWLVYDGGGWRHWNASRDCWG